MKRKFTFLLMALLALAGFKSWAQRGYTYEKLTGTPDPTAEYVLGYQNGSDYYFHSAGETTNNMTLSAPSADTRIYQLSAHQLSSLYVAAKCNDKYLAVSGGVYLANSQDYVTALEIENDGVIEGVVNGYACIYHDGDIIKSGGNSNFLYFYKRIGSSAPTYAVTVTSDTEGCTASADKDKYEAGETVTLSYTADAFHYFVEWQCSDVVITDNTFEMPANEVSVTAHFAAKPTHSITATVNPESAGTASVTYQSNTITEAPAGAVLNLSAVPNTGYDFVSWTIGGEVVSTSANYNYTMPDNDVAIVANFGEHQFLHVNIDPNIVGGTITVNPSECDPGATVTVTPNASSGYQYVYGNITVTDANGQPVYVYQGYPSSTFTMPSTDVTVSATFSKSYYISIGTQQHCTFSTNPMGSAIANADVTVFVTPEEGYRVTNVTATYEGGEITAVYSDELGGQLMYDFTMPAADVTVNVVCAQTYTVSYTQPEGGYIYVSPTTYVPAGQEVSIEITNINDHYSFDYDNYESNISVKDASENPVTVNQEDNTHYNFEMPASNVTVAVTFDEDANYDIAVTQPVGCTIEVYPSENVYANETVYLSYYNVQTGYQFVEWVVKDGEETITPEYDYGYYFTMPASENVTVTATVEALTAHTVNIAEGITGGSISAHTDYDYETPINAYEGEIVYLTNTPETGYQFVSYTVTSQCETVEVYNNFYFYMPDCDVTVSATFALAPQDLTVNDGTNTNCYVPIYADNAWSSTKSQFIIPAEQLQSMFDGTITDLTFYADLGGFNFGDARWNVYVKEVDYQTLNGLVSTEGMTLVYNGGMTIADNKLHIDFDTDYAYSDNNLLVYFELTQGGSNTWLYWYGVNTSNNTSYTWFDAYWGESSFGQSFLPKTTIRYSASDNPQTRYAITVNQPEVGGTISASKALAVEGCTITLTATPAEGYILNQWIVTDGDGTIAVTDNQFAVRTSDVAVTAVFETLPRYAITITPNEHGTIRVNYEETPDEDGYLEGERINLSAQGNEGWTLAENGYIITPADPTVTVEIQQEWNSYYFLMPACDVTISSTFRELEQYTVTYHINGVESQETVYEEQYFNPSQPTLPAGTEWFGWITDDLESSYSTTQPENRFYGGKITEDMDLYAVFKFTETVPVEGASTWERVYNSAEVSDGDHVVMVSSSYGYYFLMGQRGSEHSGNFNATSSVSETNLINGNWPENVTVFTAISESGNWKFRFKDAYHDEETYLADYNGSLVPVCQWGGDDVWAVNSGYFSNVASGRYIYFHYNSKYFDFNSSSSDFVYLYKEVKPTQTNYYYMTSVLGFGGADEHITANTEATNVVIAKNAKLTVDNGVILNVEGICLSASHDAAQLVVADGGQLIHNNAGTVATFEKNIVGYNTPGAIGNGWYFIANPTANTTVNLKEDDGSYDLYTFNPAAAAEWHNEQYIGGEQIPEENIAISRETGYLYANAANFTLKFEGELIPSGEDQTIDLVYYNGGESGREFPGFNLIGNPFSCTAYISGDFDMYKLVNGSDVEISKDGTVAPCEAFFVEATEVGETVTLSTTAPTEKSYAMPIVVNSDRGETLDRAILHLEGTRNSHKFMMNPDRTNISFAKNGERFASVSRGDETEIPMNFTADHKGSYTISFNTEDFEEEYLHLIDVVSGDNIDLLVTPSYTFEADADEYASRFRIVFGTTDINDNPATSSAPFVYISNGNLVINNVEGTASMQIVDMLGRIVRTETVSGSYNRPHNLKAGAYVITLDGRAQRIVIE